MSEPVVIHRRRSVPITEVDYAHQVKLLTKPFASDPSLDAWAAKMLAAADAFQSKKRPDPLGSFI